MGFRPESAQPDLVCVAAITSLCFRFPSFWSRYYFSIKVEGFGVSNEFTVCVLFFFKGSDKWTHQERRLFKEALSTYSKDFIFVQKMVRLFLFC